MNSRRALATRWRQGRRPCDERSRRGCRRRHRADSRRRGLRTRRARSIGGACGGAPRAAAVVGISSALASARRRSPRLSRTYASAATIAPNASGTAKTPRPWATSVSRGITETACSGDGSPATSSRIRTRAAPTTATNRRAPRPRPAPAGSGEDSQLARHAARRAAAGFGGCGCVPCATLERFDLLDELRIGLRQLRRTSRSFYACGAAAQGAPDRRRRRPSISCVRLSRPRRGSRREPAAASGAQRRASGSLPEERVATSSTMTARPAGAPSSRSPAPRSWRRARRTR